MTWQMGRPGGPLLQRVKMSLDGYVVQYSQTMGKLLERAPRLVQRVVGGLLWLRLVTVLVSSLASTSVLTHMSVLWLSPATVSGVYLALSFLEAVAWSWVVFSNPGFTQGHTTNDPENTGIPRTGKVCEVCKTLQPVRAQHCYHPLCGKCVGRFDHHSMWANNCIGAHNAGVHFAAWGLWTLNCATHAVLLICGMVYVVYTRKDTAFAVVYFMGAVISIGFGLYGYETFRQLYGLMKEAMTSYEDMNMRFISYYRGPGGYFNPWTHGLKSNLMDLFGLGTDWTKVQWYTLLDIPHHPGAKQMHDRFAKVRQALDSGVQLDDDTQAALVMYEKQYGRAGGDKTSSAATVAVAVPATSGVVESKPLLAAV